MKFRKDEWERVKYGDYVSHIEITETDPENRKSARYVSVEHIETGSFSINSWFEEEMPTFFRTFKKGQILFGKRRAYQKKVAIAEFEGICSPHIWVLEAEKDLLQDFLPYLMLSDRFYEYVNANSAGTMSPYLKWPQLSSYTFLLPSLSEQKQITALFQSLENAIELVEKQENKLKNLQKTLVNGLLNENPIFGNLLNQNNCKAVKFAEISECDKKYEEHKKPITRFIGLENIESENFKIQGSGDIEKGTTFTKRFVTGDVLFGKRRAYLKKVAIADFDGLCSGDILVLRAKEKQILPNLLPFYVSADAFIQHAVNTSAGSLSPRTKWKDLAEFEICLPDLETQQQIASVLDNILQNIEQLKQQKANLKNLKQKLLSEILG